MRQTYSSAGGIILLGLWAVVAAAQIEQPNPPPPPLPHSGAAAAHGLDLRAELGKDFRISPVDDLSFAPEMADRARAQIFDLVRAGWPPDASASDQRLAARALWLGACLEHRAMLVRTDAEPRRLNAWRAAAYARKLREFCRERSVLALEGADLAARENWVRALVKLEAIEADAAPAARIPARPVEHEVRYRVLDAYAGAVPDGDGDGGPAERLMRAVSQPFAAARDLAAAAVAAKVQASVAAGYVYGYAHDPAAVADLVGGKPVDRRAADTALLAPGERAAVFPPRPGAASPAGLIEWAKVAELVMDSYGGGERPGVVGTYAMAREALRLNGGPTPVDLLSRNGPPIKPDDPRVGAAYAVDDLARSADLAINPARDWLPARPRDPKRPERPDKFDLFGKSPATALATLTDYAPWVLGEYPRRTLASAALADLQRDLPPDRAPGQASPIPISADDVSHLSTIAALGIPQYRDRRDGVVPDEAGRQYVAGLLADSVRSYLPGVSAWFATRTADRATAPRPATAAPAAAPPPAGQPGAKPAPGAAPAPVGAQTRTEAQ